MSTLDFSWLRRRLRESRVRFRTHNRAGQLYHLRVNHERLEELFAELGIELRLIKPSDAALDRFKTYHAIDPKTRSYCYVVNTFQPTSRRYLLPAGLNLAGKKLSIERLTKRVTQALKRRFTGPTLDYCLALISLSASEHHHVKAPREITRDELNQLAIHLGEIIGALWYAKRMHATHVIFPKAESHPLFDFTLIKADGQRVKVSFKANRGSSTSIATLESRVDHLLRKKAAAPRLIKAITALVKMSSVDGILEAHRHLNTAAFKKAIELGVTDWSRAGIEAWLNSLNEADLTRALSELFSAMKPTKRTASDGAIQTILKGGISRVGLLTSPLGYNLADILNADRRAVEILNALAREIDVVQVHLALRRNALSFTAHRFSDGKFAWSCSSCAKRPTSRRLSFKLVDDDK